MECKKCGHIWQEKKEKPRTCPACHRYNYNEPRKWKVDKLKQEQPTPIIIGGPGQEVGESW